MALDWQAIGSAVVAIVLGVGGYLGGRIKRNAEDRAEVAQANASASIADAEGTLYKRLREEIDALRGDVGRLRADLDQERRHGRALELHVWKLERLMRERGIEPPPFVEVTVNETTNQPSN